MSVLRRINRSPLYTKYMFQSRQRLAEWIWRRQGKPPGVPAPHTVKQDLVRQYARRFSLRTLIESGTYLGNMVYAMRNDFDEIHSMELDEVLFRRAQRLFASYSNIHILRGDSRIILAGIVDRLKDPALFWLDGHYAGSGTAKTETESPIIGELDVILSSGVDHVVLIDDARLFFSRHEDYPAIIDLQERFHALRPDYYLRAEDDMLQAYKRPEPQPAAAPRLSVRVDGRPGSVRARPGDRVRVTFGLEPGNHFGAPCHLWLLASTPKGSYWFVRRDWVASETPQCYGKFRIFELSPTLLWAARPLSMPGRYLFAIILSEGEEADFRASYYGCAEVLVSDGS